MRSKVVLWEQTSLATALPEKVRAFVVHTVLLFGHITLFHQIDAIFTQTMTVPRKVLPKVTVSLSFAPFT
jgi:hypothetical protein